MPDPRVHSSSLHAHAVLEQPPTDLVGRSYEVVRTPISTGTLATAVSARCASARRDTVDESLDQLGQRMDIVNDVNAERTTSVADDYERLYQPHGDAADRQRADVIFEFVHELIENQDFDTVSRRFADSPYVQHNHLAGTGLTPTCRLHPTPTSDQPSPAARFCTYKTKDGY